MSKTFQKYLQHVVNNICVRAGDPWQEVFTEDQIDFLRQQYQAGVKPLEAAWQLMY